MKIIQRLSLFLILTSILSSCSSTETSFNSFPPWVTPTVGTRYLVDFSGLDSNNGSIVRTVARDSMQGVSTTAGTDGLNSTVQFFGEAFPDRLTFSEQYHSSGDISILDSDVTGIHWQVYPTTSRQSIIDAHHDSTRMSDSTIFFYQHQLSSRTFIGVEQISVLDSTYTAIHVQGTAAQVVVNLDSYMPYDSTVTFTDYWFTPPIGMWLERRITTTTFTKGSSKTQFDRWRTEIRDGKLVSISRP